MDISGYYNYLKLIQRHYRNWPTVLIERILKWEPKKLVLRCGKTIYLRNQEIALSNLLEHGWAIIDVKDDIVAIRKDECFLCRLKEGWDFGHLDEIYLHKVYGEKFSGTVIDVGASNGDSSVFFAKRGADMVIALEPYPESYRLAQRNVELNGLTHKIKLVNAALASGRGRIKLKVSTKSPNANSLDPTCQVLRMGINFDLEVEVPSLTLQDIFDEYDLERVSLLKMDCEGCEYNVLRNMDKAIFKKIDAVVLEYHNGAQDIPNILVDNGFKPGYNNLPLGLLYATKTSFKK